MSCFSIERGSIPDCDNLPMGTKSPLTLINWDDVLYVFESIGEVTELGNVWDPSFDFTFGPVITTGGEVGVITRIVLKPGRTAYRFECFGQEVKSEEEVAPTNLRNRFIHATGCVIYEIDQVQKNNIKSMSKGRFMAIVEHRGNDGNWFELLGRECGLKMAAGVLRDAHGTNGLFVITLRTPDNGVEFERKLPQRVGHSYETGLQIIAELFGEDIGFEMEDETAIFESESGLIFVPE